VRFLLDENVDARLLSYLIDHGHDATQIPNDYPFGLVDEQVLMLAVQEQRVLVTNDKDFGELVFRARLPHVGIILFRLGDYAPLPMLIARLEFVLNRYSDKLDQFLTVTPYRIRVRHRFPF
jgi:predicted nuclease of predicted toxin-antitoxin system